MFRNTPKKLQVAIATNTGSTAFERVSIFEEIMHREGVTIVKKVMFDENTDANEMMNSGQLGDLAANARSLFQQFNYL